MFSGSVVFNRGVMEGHGIEFVWTVFPSFILIFIALPSLGILYLMDEEFGRVICYKVIGHQWYWSYEYFDCSGVEHDSYLLGDALFRLFDCDFRLYCPYYTPLRFLITSQDVIHSWAIPSIGVKIDAVPGRLNQVNFIISRPGVYFGQCSELCGANHSFMPISLESVNYYDYLELLGLFWLDGRFKVMAS